MHPARKHPEHVQGLLAAVRFAQHLGLVHNHRVGSHQHLVVCQEAAICLRLFA